ncbi:unnamed protein product [Symbiodinium sp. CCMP2592]|nr:unnamed protein product [Symbiodinium sp. CCMP2592]
MAWHLLFLILVMADAHASCDPEPAEDAFVQLTPGHGRSSRARAEPSTPQSQLQNAFQNAKLCLLIQYPKGGPYPMPPCNFEPVDCADPAIALCCYQCLPTVHGCDGPELAPPCQARNAACEMALFMVDDANPLAQPHLYVVPGTYPSAAVSRPEMLAVTGGYNLDMWQVLQNLTAICFGDNFEWLRHQSDFIKKKSDAVDFACSDNGAQCELNPNSTASTPEGEDAMKRMQQILRAASITAGDLLIQISTRFTPAGKIAATIFQTASGLALETTSGLPTNPCTYAGTEWGQCVWWQVRTYVERYVTSYVKEALKKYNHGQLEDRLGQIQTQLKSIKQHYKDQVNSKESIEYVVQQMEQLRNKMVGDGTWFLDSELLVQFFTIDVTRQFLNSSLKRGTYFMQNRMSELKAIKVNRTKYLFGDHVPYYYFGQFDAMCQTTENDAFKDSPYICDPAYGHYDEGMNRATACAVPRKTAAIFLGSTGSATRSDPYAGNDGASVQMLANWMVFNWDNHDTDAYKGHDWGIFTPKCNEANGQRGYVAVGSVGENFLKNWNFTPDDPPEPSNWPNLMCVKEEYTETVSMDKGSWTWGIRKGYSAYSGIAWVGKPYNTADGVLVNGPCHAKAGWDASDWEPYQVHQLKESLVKWLGSC